MLHQIRKHRVRAFAAGAAMLFAGAASSASAGSINIRVTPEVRVVKTSPQPKSTTVNARWSNRTPAQRVMTTNNSLRAVHYPTVVLGTVNYIQPSTAINATASRNGDIAIASGELLPMTIGSLGVTADGTVVNGTVVNDAATVGVVTTPVGAVRTPVGVIRSDFIGIAGPGGSPFGVAGPAFLPDGAIIRPTRNRAITSGVSTGVVSGVGRSSNLVIGNGTGAISSECLPAEAQLATW